MRFTVPRSRGGRLTEALLRLVLVAAFAGFVFGVAAQRNASAAFIQDPIDIVGAGVYVPPGVDYPDFTIANGDPNEEVNSVWPARGGGILPAPLPLPRLDVSALPGFTRHGLLKLGETDRMSGTFPEDMEAYDLGPYYAGGGGEVDEVLQAHGARGMSGETDAAAE